jgi:hypothetical protein
MLRNAGIQAADLSAVDRREAVDFESFYPALGTSQLIPARLASALEASRPIIAPLLRIQSN